ncbi:ATP-binding protein [Aquiflexum sp. TKW24L]|uniref:sensor histidine kinase n=1 Tax=Aquiflexum sp. TKW24L TaxID=2942212 RepID=UPI0020BE7FA8|nr:ATP-binding protein [Aquiflexum sp. TKW24L]MCL6258209.1 ATP-binding protein [Aquiflexum sp. TKW24L]
MKLSAKQSALKIEELQSRLDEYEQLIEAIKGGEVDAFALKTNNQSEIFTLRTVDYAYRLLVENFGEGALNLTEEGLIVYTNNFFPQLLNLSYEDVIGNSFYQYIHPESIETFNELFKTALTAQAKGEIFLSIADLKVPVYISLTSLFPTIPTVGMIITDLTEKKKEEEILKIKNAELEKLNSELHTFAYITSHDLQGPLRKIQLLISYIIDKERIQLSDKGKDYLNRVQYAANSMQVLIQDLLDYSRTNSTEGKLEYTHLKEIIDEVKDQLKDEIKDKKAIIEAKKLSSVHIIPFQFRQLMYNLIGNALKFSNPAQRPLIIIKSKIAKGMAFDNAKLSPQVSYCHISISDNGIGFEPEYSEKIFEIFFRLHEQAEFKGTGIGLAIVKKIVENHGGIITANSKLNIGTTFDIFIPTALED